MTPGISRTGVSCAGEVHPLKRRRGIRSLKARIRQVRVSKLCTEQHRIVEDRSGHSAAGKVDAGELGAIEIDTAERGELDRRQLDVTVGFESGLL